jgi:GNAT superfamily N-acetyltransferase
MTHPNPYELRSPTTAEDWERYHAIRRRVLFEARGRGHLYNAHHPDERRPENHPKLLLHTGDTIGVVRIDLTPPRAIFRRVAVREDVQRRGHGRALLALAEEFARAHGCSEVMSFVDPDAVGFYAKCGFAVIGADAHRGATVPMAKQLSPAGVNGRGDR